jgi:ABC-type antimicrobial peptide transport system permease subunit
MDVYLVIGVIAGAVVSIVLSCVLLKLGTLIDRYPDNGEQERDISNWSPEKFTRILVFLFWPFFIAGAIMVFQPSRFLLIGGITLIAALLLMLGTAVVFSAAVYRAIAGGKNESSGEPPAGLIQEDP